MLCVEFSQTCEGDYQALLRRFEAGSDFIDPICDINKVLFDLSDSLLDLLHVVPLVGAWVSDNLPWMAHSGQMVVRHPKQ